MNTNSIKKVGVFFGSRSPEHDVSIITAQVVMKTLKNLGIDFIPIYVTKSGDFVYSEKFLDVSFFSSGGDKIEQFASKIPPIKISLNAINENLLKEKGFELQISSGFFGLNKKSIYIDIAFPCFHGSYGEDGTMQGLFELIGIPYVGCNVLVSSVTMNKVTTKYILKANGIRTPDFYVINKAQFADKEVLDELIHDIEDNLKYPVFVKPSELGSSIGIRKATDRQSLLEGLETGFFYDRTILIEKAVQNLRDLTICLIGNSPNIRASLIQETKFKFDLLDFSQKYLDNGGAQTGSNKSAIIIPPQLDKVTEQNIIELAKRTYNTLGCTGIARVDVLLDSLTNDYFVSEVNTMPGTIYNHLWEKSGMKTTDLVKRLLTDALEEYKEKKNLSRVFNSNILQTLGNSSKLSKKISSV